MIWFLLLIAVGTAVYFARKSAAQERVAENVAEVATDIARAAWTDAVKSNRRALALLGEALGQLEAQVKEREDAELPLDTPFDEGPTMALVDALQEYGSAALRLAACALRTGQDVTPIANLAIGGFVHATGAISDARPYLDFGVDVRIAPPLQKLWSLLDEGLGQFTPRGRCEIGHGIAQYVEWYASQSV